MSWLVGGRDSDYAMAFIDDLSRRLANRVQLTSDGHRAYLEAGSRSRVFAGGWVRIPFNFPIVAIVGENGSGKSTILQCAASTHQPPANARRSDDSKNSKGWFASDFLPKTIWEDVRAGEIKFSLREGDRSRIGTVRQPGDRWRGNPERPVRSVNYIDLRRLQPIVARTGCSKLAKDATMEMSAAAFDKVKLARLSQIMGRPFGATRMALTDADEKRIVPVFQDKDQTYSGYHAGAGQIAEFLRVEPEQHSLLLIDEIETSLHPARAAPSYP